MEIKGLSRGLGFIILMTGLMLSPCYADEILFKDQTGAKIGTVLEIDEETVTIRFPKELIKSVIMSRGGVSYPEKDEILFKDEKGAEIGTVLQVDEQSVTIRFPKESIQSIIMSREGASYPEKKELHKSIPLTDLELQERIKGIEERIEGVEKDIQEEKKAGVPPTKGRSANVGVQEQLLLEEMGSVQGTIEWRKKPLNNGQVKIVLQKYTGFSWASVKAMFTGEGKEKSSQEKITLFAKTDSRGRYAFSKVPPGHYRIYWVPQDEAEWYHRFRDRPDFEVITGQLTVQNIPEKKK
jgi:hypothetical protein